MNHENGNHTNGRDAIRIFVCGSCEGSASLVEALAQESEFELVGVSPSAGDSAGVLAGGHLNTILLATDSQTLPADELAVIREHTRAPVIVLASGEASQLLEQALDADVSDVLLLPQLVDNVIFAIRKAAHAGRRLVVAGAGAVTHGRIVTVFSPKGGTGKTSITTNLATALAKHENKRALLLDLDLQFGDAAIMLGLQPEKTIYDLVSAPGELDPEKLSGYTTRHSSGFDILPAPLRPEDAELVTEAKIGRLLEVARTSYDVIVVDTSPFFHGPMLATLDQTDELLLVCSLDVPTIKNVRLSLQTLELLSFPMKKVQVVLNRANTKVGMKESEVETALERKVRHQIPSDRAVPLSINRGNPVVLADSGSDFSSAIRSVAKAVANPEPDKNAKRRRLFAKA
ncbi:MAG TPA: AAA family ATPase [Gaiellaceae bacterium]|jgi:pilus assembly protein CpaE